MISNKFIAINDLTMKIFINLLFISVLIVKTSLATNYYVSPDGSDSNPGTFNEPWKSVGKATTTSTAGDTVFIREGIYKEVVTFSNSGTVNNPIVITAFNKEIAIIDGNNNTAAIIYGNKNNIEIHKLNVRNGKSWGILFENDENIIINNCIINDVGRSAIRTISASNVAITNNSINNTTNFEDYDGGIRSSYNHNIIIKGNKITNIDNYGILVEGSDSILIEDNYTFNTFHSGVAPVECKNLIVKDNTIVLACNGGYGECLSVRNCNQFLVYHNEIHTSGNVEYGGEGIDLSDGSRNGKLFNNYIHDIDKTGLYVDSYEKYTHDLEVFGNKLINCNQGIAVGAEQGELVENVHIYSNIICNSYGNGINIASWVEDGLRKNIVINNNSVYNNGEDIYYGGGIKVESSNVENISIFNNICSQNLQFQIGVVQNALDEVLISNNLIDGGQEDEISVNGLNYINASPGFIDISKIDLHLAESSLAIDAGLPDSAYFDPDCTPSDIGAFYFNQHPNLVAAINPVGDIIMQEDDSYQLVIDDIQNIFPQPDLGTYQYYIESDISKIMTSLNGYSLYVRPVNNVNGTSKVIITARDGCLIESSDTFSVEIKSVNDAPLIYNLPDNIGFDKGSLKELVMSNYVIDFDSPESSLNWSFKSSNDSLVIQFDTESTILNLTSNGYVGDVTLYCTVSNESLLNATDSIIVKITGTDPITEPVTILINKEENNQFQIYPNPANNILFIQFENTEIHEFHYEIVDYSGKSIKYGINLNNSIDISDLDKGLYLFKIQIDNSNYVREFLKE